jgi:hypothetical protein
LIVVDDYLTRTIALGDREELPDGETVVTTWGFHYRLVRALIDNRTTGALSWGDATEALMAVSRPERHGVAVIDPRLVTTTAATLAIEHRLNLLTAELMAAAQVHQAEVVLTERNVGRRWPGLFEELGITLTVV